jgi:NitT/TauT family transport system permease protein
MAAVNRDKPRTFNLSFGSSVLRQVAFYAALLVLWYWYAHSGLTPSYTFADPMDVGQSLVSGFRSGVFELAIVVTLRRLIIGYIISLVIGVVLGLLIGRNKYVKETIGSLVLGLQALPSVCWVPFALLWFGLSESAMIFVVVMGALFSITLGVEAGVKNTPPLYLKAARNMGASGFALTTQVVLPAAMPSILSGLKQGWTFAWRSLMAAELIYITSQSLGGQLSMARDLSDYGLLLSVMFIIVAIGVLTEVLIFSPFERNVRTRWGFN